MEYTEAIIRCLSEVQIELTILFVFYQNSDSTWTFFFLQNLATITLCLLASGAVIEKSVIPPTSTPLGAFRLFPPEAERQNTQPRLARVQRLSSFSGLLAFAPFSTPTSPNLTASGKPARC